MTLVTRSKRSPPVVAICGNGASAVALLHALAASALIPLTIVVIGTGEPGAGLAYATRNASHLLNTPAGRMSVHPDEPDQFVQWLRKRDLWTPGWDNQFVPRQHYGRYLRDAAAMATLVPGLTVRFLQGQVISLTRAGKAEFGAMAAQHEEWIADLFGDLSKKDQADLMRLLAKTKLSARRAMSGDAQ